MKKYFFYITGVLLLALGILSCDKNDDSHTEGSDAKFLLTEHWINGNIAGKFEYDNQNRRIRYNNGTGMIEYSYNAKGFLAATVYKEQGMLTHREDYTYGTDNKPVSMTISNPNDEDFIESDVSYTYSENKIVETHTPRENGGSVTINSYQFNGEGNLVELTTQIGAYESVTTWSEYDKKVGAALHGDPYYWKNSKNNALKFNVFSGTFSLEQKWEYTYNNNGYPVKAFVYNNGSDEIAEEHIFTYMPAK